MTLVATCINVESDAESCSRAANDTFCELILFHDFKGNLEADFVLVSYRLIVSKKWRRYDSTSCSWSSISATDYNYHEDVESLEGYRPGGYHPVELDDEVSRGRYRIIHKLGFGSYSTVWLARDQQVNRYVALKILVAECSDNDSEEKTLWHLVKSRSTRTVQAYICSILDQFFIDGPNGRHRCLVTDVAGCNLADSKEASLVWKFPLTVSRAIAAQAILAVQAIHSTGVIHGGA